MFLVNSRPGQFLAAPWRFWGKPIDAGEPPFSLSYGVSVPSSLTWVLSIVLADLRPAYQWRFAVRAPVVHNHEAFLDSLGSTESPSRRTGKTFPAPQLKRPPRICLWRPRLRLGTHHVQWVRSAYHPVSPLGFKRTTGGAGILTSCPSSTPCGLD